jgi:hypothetical protein
MSKSTKRITLFQCKHALEFGLEIVELKEKGNTLAVMGVCCLFCVYCGRDVELSNHKHKSIDNIHIFKVSFIKQHYLSRLKHHAETWEDYNELFIDNKKARSSAQTQCTCTSTPARMPFASLFVADRQCHHQKAFLSQ